MPVCYKQGLVPAPKLDSCCRPEQLEDHGDGNQGAGKICRAQHINKHMQSEVYKVARLVPVFAVAVFAPLVCECATSTCNAHQT